MKIVLIAFSLLANCAIAAENKNNCDCPTCPKDQKICGPTGASLNRNTSKVVKEVSSPKKKKAVPSKAVGQ